LQPLESESYTTRQKESNTMSAKEQFCRLARELVNDESLGIKEYEKGLDLLSEWHDSSASEVDKANIRAIHDWFVDARQDERKHQERAAVIVAVACKEQV
jgi:hypothetical protein